jgi:PPOX class probable F420-dependent enzyme
MTPDIERALQQATLLYITTYNTTGQSGTVPIWFFCHDAAIYFCSLRDSLKVRRLRQTGRATVHIGSPTGPRLDCRAHLLEEDPLLRTRLLRTYRRRYGWRWLIIGPRLYWAFARGKEVIIRLCFLADRGQDGCSNEPI